jgi:hypothetical protein
MPQSPGVSQGQWPASAICGFPLESRVRSNACHAVLFVEFASRYVPA